MGLIGKDEGKIATGRFRFNIAAREGSSLSRDANNGLNEGKFSLSTPESKLSLCPNTAARKKREKNCCLNTRPVQTRSSFTLSREYE